MLLYPFGEVEDYVLAPPYHPSSWLMHVELGIPMGPGVHSFPPGQPSPLLSSASELLES